MEFKDKNSFIEVYSLSTRLFKGTILPIKGKNQNGNSNYIFKQSRKGCLTLKEIKSIYEFMYAKSFLGV